LPALAFRRNPYRSGEESALSIDLPADMATTGLPTYACGYLLFSSVECLTLRSGTSLRVLPPRFTVRNKENGMNLKKFLVASFSGFTMMAATAQQGMAAFLHAPAQGGTVIVNQTNGSVTYCVAQVTATIITGTPTGKCAKIGTLPTLVLSGPLSISTASANAFIVNVNTGALFNCALTSTNGSPTGTCLTSQAQ
jgi:hypothetical protein